MKITINSTGQFRDQFQAMGRSNEFSYSGLCAFFEYLEECDPDMELDVIAICCDFSEYASAIEACVEMSSDWDKDIDSQYVKDIEKIALEHLQDRTSVISGYDGYKCIVKSF